MKKMIWFSFVAMLLFVVTGVRAEESAADRISDSAQSAADKTDKVAHKAKRKIKHHARKAKTDIQNSTDDNGARKAGRRMKDTGNDALDLS